MFCYCGLSFNGELFLSDSGKVSNADHISNNYPPPGLLFVDYFCNMVCYDMSEVAETEVLQLQIEELRA